MDDIGNVLVSDGGNNRLQVFSNDGKYMKLGGEVDYRYVSPCGLCRVDNNIYVAYRGGQFGAIVKYSMD